MLNSESRLMITLRGIYCCKILTWITIVNIFIILYIIETISSFDDALQDIIYRYTFYQIDIKMYINNIRNILSQNFCEIRYKLANIFYAPSKAWSHTQTH